MERGSDKHSPRIDEGLRSETEGMMRAGRDTRAEEWKSAEPSGEDEPEVDLAPNGTLAGGTPDGMTQEDVAGRSELAVYLGKDVYPAGREELIEHATGANAPDRVLDELRRLPEDRTYANASDVWSTLGGGTEETRF